MEGIEIVVEDVALNVEQYEAIQASVQRVNDSLQTVNASVVHATTFLILLVVFQFYGLLSRARKKGGV